ncbi:hypothetical protein DPMN_149657 [Dreissena polymorpha]|uniref:Secreted protein n=1 Tax=Dreissena polymorpha TaxID=45954 RepID=A0A9D4FC64_DREPO|nr:hypothetical protein DPMN_149657 [Dreissena polymorpha]
MVGLFVTPLLTCWLARFARLDAFPVTICTVRTQLSVRRKIVGVYQVFPHAFLEPASDLFPAILTQP